LDSSDPTGTVPIGFWMHRSCVPLVSPHHFSGIFWPTLRPIIEELWRQGRQTLFYAEGNWDYHLADFATLPAQSIVYHLDQGDPRKARRAFDGRFCLSGGIPNALLAYGTPAQVRAKCREVLEICAGDAPYIMDASAIVQNDASVENMRAMTEATLEHGIYTRGPPAPRPARWNPGSGLKTAGPPSSATPRW
jgi:uroporphyrinogen-III decarboxylase